MITFIKVLLHQKSREGSKCVRSCSSAASLENSKSATVMKMNIWIKHWSVEMWWRRNEGVPWCWALCVYGSYLFISECTVVLQCWKRQGWTHPGSLNPPERGHKSGMVKPIGPLKLWYGKVVWARTYRCCWNTILSLFRVFGGSHKHVLGLLDPGQPYIFT